MNMTTDYNEKKGDDIDEMNMIIRKYISSSCHHLYEIKQVINQ